MREHTKREERTCDVDDCGKKHLAKGYCRQHYRAIANPDKPRDRRTLITCIDCGAEALKHYGTKTCHERCQTCARSHDHVIPMSMGGPHTYGNTQLACLECNTNKGATLTP